MRRDPNIRQERFQTRKKSVQAATQITANKNRVSRLYGCILKIGKKAKANRQNGQRFMSTPRYD